MSHPMADRFTEHTHPAGFTLGVPEEWEVAVDPRADVALLALAPEPDPWGFRANLLVTVDDLDAGMTLHAWQAGADERLPAALTDYLLIDLDHVHVGERAGIRRLAHHAANGRAVTMEQWATIAAPRGYTLTASVSTLAYPSLSDRLGAVAAGFRVEPEPHRSRT